MIEDPDQTQAAKPELTSHFPERPPLIPDYQLVRLLGKGGFGEVWLAKTKTGVYRAVKILSRSALSAVEFDGIRTFEKHARGHGNLIDIRHVGEAGGCWYYVMELADGVEIAQTFSDEDYEPRTLFSEIRRRNHLAPREAVEICRAILNGLSHLHRNELLHRDVKPANVVFVDRIAKLADIGLLTHERRREVEGHTPLYAPPGGVVDRTGDLYCVGRILHEMVSGTRPERFPEIPKGADEERLAAIRRIMPIVDRACAPETEDRFQTAEEFLEALDALEPNRPKSRLPRVAAAAIVIALAALAIIAWDPLANRCELSVLVKETKESAFHFNVAERLPLRAGDLIRLRASFEQPCYPAVLLITGESGVQKWFPKDLAAQSETRTLEIPSPEGEFLPITETATGGPDTITFVLLARAEPFTQDSIDLIAERVATLGEPPMLGRKTMVRLADGKLERITGTGTRTRGVDFGTPVKTRIGLLERLHAELADSFDVVEAIAIPQRSGAAE